MTILLHVAQEVGERRAAERTVMALTATYTDTTTAPLTDTPIDTHTATTTATLTATTTAALKGTLTKPSQICVMCNQPQLHSVSDKPPPMPPCYL